MDIMEARIAIKEDLEEEKKDIMDITLVIMEWVLDITEALIVIKEDLEEMTKDLLDLIVMVDRIVMKESVRDRVECQGNGEDSAWTMMQGN